MSRTATTERSPRVSSGLWLLLLALVAGIGAYALVGLGKRGACRRASSCTAR